MSSAIASLGGPSLTQWVQSVTKRKGHRAAASNTTAGSSGTTGAQGTSNGVFLSQIQQAVTTALQSAQSDGASDPNQVIEDAITKLLKNMGVGSNRATAASTNSPANPSPAQTAPSDSANQAFASLLESVGISPQQFQADFQAAVRDAQRGSVNPNTALRNIPIGSTLDVTG
ncbi:MAG: hypothetical protein ABSB74_03455 [Tepidisphaeraceae bacterium]